MPADGHERYRRSKHPPDWPQTSKREQRGRRLQSFRNAHQRGDSAAQEGILRRDLEGLPIQQLPDLLGHFGVVQLADLPERQAIKLLEQAAQATLQSRQIGSFADKP